VHPLKSKFQRVPNYLLPKIEACKSSYFPGRNETPSADQIETRSFFLPIEGSESFKKSFSPCKLISVLFNHGKRQSRLTHYRCRSETEKKYFTGSFQFSILCLHDLPSLPQSLFSRSLRSTICNPGHPHPMRTLRITNGPERAK